MQNIVVNVYIAFMFLLSVLLGACGSSVSFCSDYVYADSLYNDVTNLRYKNASHLHAVATALDSVLLAGGKTCDSAINAKAYADFIMMNFAEAYNGYNRVIENSENEIEILVAEVGLVQLCYRTSANKEFFDYRSSALRRIKRINEDRDLLPFEDLQRFLSARVELAAVSLCYFVNLGMYEEMLRAVEYIKNHSKELDNSAMRIYSAMILNYRTDIPVQERMAKMRIVLRRAVANEQNWLMANCRLMLAVMLRDNPDSISSADYSFLSSGTDSFNANELPFMLAMKAVEEFADYGDRFMMIEALAVAASCKTYNGDFEQALLLLDRAMGEINTYYTNHSDDVRLAAMVLDNLDEEVEELRMNSVGVYNIYEPLLSVRREAASAFAGIGDKYASDINRNSYLDLLYTTRQNKRMESRINATRENSARLYVWFVVSIIILLSVVSGSIFMNRRWRRRNNVYINDLTSILRLCRGLMASMPQDLSSEEEVCGVVSEIIDRGLVDFSPGSRFSVVPCDSSSELEYGVVYEMPLPDSERPQALCLRVVSHEPLSCDKRDILSVLLPYISVAIDEGRRIANIGDEQQRLEQQRLSYFLYAAEHKRENVLKRVLMSVINNMRPYMNRMLNELNWLDKTEAKGDVEHRRLDYLAELTVALDEYNAALEHWIKISSGELSLHIENFCVSDLLAIIAKGEQAFALKGLHLEVCESKAVVKADKALTLFMMNTLVDNAGKFTPSGGRVSLDVEEGDGFVEIAVTDTGIGMEPEEAEGLLVNRIYRQHVNGGNAELSGKGGGFGLMNCKGIIDKYRKTDAFFDVCRMDISSEPGKGSRFSFRLPKGVVRTLVSLLLIVLPFYSYAVTVDSDKIRALADSVYSCNVEGRYYDAIEFARSVIGEVNSVYVLTTGGKDTLSLVDGNFAEITWWRNKLFPDSLTEDIFYNLLDVRNETAVAALALNEWSLYRYNNSVYALLYRLVHEDTGIAVHYENMRRVANYRHAAVVLCVTMLLMFITVYIVVYLRRVITERANTRLLLHANERLSGVVGIARDNIPALADNMAQSIYDEVCEHLCVRCVTVFLKKEKVHHCATVPNSYDSVAEKSVYRVYETGDSYIGINGQAVVIPLVIVHSGERLIMGAVAFDTTRRLTESEYVTLELIVDYAASMVYYSTVCLAEKYRSLGELEEETELMRIEENRLHVCNLVMDNCLSVIKHETMYYPGRIRRLVQQLLDDDFDVMEWRHRVAAIRELMDYYNSVFVVLGDCAMRQLDDIGFTLSSVSLDTIAKRMQRYVDKIAVKKGLSLILQYEESHVSIVGDEVLVITLFEALFRALTAVALDGTIAMYIYDDDRSVRVEVVDMRRRLQPKELTELFSPVSCGKTDDGLSFLIVKEIVRIHEESTGLRGGRVEVCNCEQGAKFMFTLPK